MPALCPRQIVRRRRALIEGAIHQLVTVRFGIAMPRDLGFDLGALGLETSQALLDFHQLFAESVALLLALAQLRLEHFLAFSERLDLRLLGRHVLLALRLFL